MRPATHMLHHRDTSSTAAQYVRMSTDLQRDSPANQKEVLAQYAERNAIHIARTYEDYGKSGLSMRNRPALARLLHDVLDEKRIFSVLLVYDISRWGRFQDVDESAHYEYICRRAGVRVIYCAEPFENDNSASSNILKTLKRAMAGEYSRELSSKVFLGQCRGTREGFRQGAAAGYALQRVLVDCNGNVKGPLQNGERKNLQSDHVVIVPGLPNEVALVRRVFEWFLKERLSLPRIAQRLNDFGLRTDLNRIWLRDGIFRLLTSEKYAGNNVYNRTSVRLHTPRIKNPPAQWVRAVGVFEPVVDRATFDAAQLLLGGRTHLLPDDDLLVKLAALRKSAGKLTAKTINSDRMVPGVQTYRKRFGSLIEAYRAIGFDREHDYRYLHVLRAAKVLLSRLADTVISALRESGHQVRHSPDKTLLCIDDELRIKLNVRPATRTPYKAMRWIIRWPELYPIDILLIARTDRFAADFIDFFVFPRGSLGPQKQTELIERPTPHLEMFRFSELKILLELTARAPLEVLHEPRNAPDNNRPD
jgi:DNA invertase Pin-like site-specific DNA recombinase